MAIYQWLGACVGILVVATFCSGSSPYGRCNETHFLTEAFGCERRFFKALAWNDNITNCSELYDSHIRQCYNHTLVTCFRDEFDGWRDNVEIVLFMLEAHGHSKLFCGIEGFQIKELPPKLQKIFPCSNEYLEEGRNCTKNFAKMLAENRMNPLLCRAMDEAFECTWQASLKYCENNLEFPEVLKDENPFCERNRLASTTHKPMEKVQTMSRDYTVGMPTHVRTSSPAVQLGCATHAHALIVLSAVLLWY